jgi:hypothetical protein
MIQDYNHDEHLHRFACWTASRAAQRGWGKATVETITRAIEKVKFPSSLRALYDRSPNVVDFDDWHQATFEELKVALVDQGIEPKSITYGRVAKIIAIYIKTVFISNDPTSQLARVAHPPIDGILLRNIKSSEEGKKYGIQYPKEVGVNWTKFDKDGYYTVVKFLRSTNGDKPFWQVEAFWQIG